VPTSPSTVALLTLQVAPRLAGPAVFKALLRGSVRCPPPPLPACEARCSPGLPFSGASTSAIPSAPPSVQPTIRWPALGPQTSVGTPLAEGMLPPVGLSARAGGSSASARPPPVAVCEDLAAAAANPVHRAGRPPPCQGMRTGRVGTSPVGRREGVQSGDHTSAERSLPSCRCRRRVIVRTCCAVHRASVVSPKGACGVSLGRRTRTSDGPCAPSSVCLPAAAVVRCGFAVRGTSRLTGQV